MPDKIIFNDRELKELNDFNDLGKISIEHLEEFLYKNLPDQFRRTGAPGNYTGYTYNNDVTNSEKKYPIVLSGLDYLFRNINGNDSLHVKFSGIGLTTNNKIIKGINNTNGTDEEIITLTSTRTLYFIYLIEKDNQDYRYFINPAAPNSTPVSNLVTTNKEIQWKVGSKNITGIGDTLQDVVSYFINDNNFESQELYRIPLCTVKSDKTLEFDLLPAIFKETILNESSPEFTLSNDYDRESIIYKAYVSLRKGIKAILENIKEIKGTSKWYLKPLNSLNGLYNTLVSHKIASPIDHPDSSITTSKIADSAITTPKIQNLAITSDKIGDSAVITNKISDLAVTTSKINDLAVTSLKIADLAVIERKIAPNAVTTTKIADGAITTTKISDIAVTTGKLSPNAVTTDKILDGNITRDKMSRWTTAHPFFKTMNNPLKMATNSSDIITTTNGWKFLKVGMDQWANEAGKYFWPVLIPASRAFKGWMQMKISYLNGYIWSEFPDDQLISVYIAICGDNFNDKAAPNMSNYTYNDTNTYLYYQKLFEPYSHIKSGLWIDFRTPNDWDTAVGVTGFKNVLIYARALAIVGGTTYSVEDGNIAMQLITLKIDSGAGKDLYM